MESYYTILTGLGESIKDLILNVARIVAGDFVPGIIALAIFLALIVAGGRFLYVTWQRANALSEARRIVKQAPDKRTFAARQVDFARTFDTWRDGKDKARQSIGRAFEEFFETVEHKDDVVRNGIRPSIFFNLTDLHFSPGPWQAVPGLFVTSGLLLTFLGLVAALEGAAGTLDPEQQKDALKQLLTVASAKFIMSLTGLAASIVFTVLLRRGMYCLERESHELCVALETRIGFVSLETLAGEQVAQTRDLKEHLTSLNTELIAELGRPLREEIPAAISRSIAEALAPVMDRVGKAGTEGVVEIVGDLSRQLSMEVGAALGTASDRLAEAAARLESLAARMDTSADKAGARMDESTARLAAALEALGAGMERTALETRAALAEGAQELLGSMNTALERIRENTAESAEALRKAIETMVGAGQEFRKEIDQAATAASSVAAAEMAAAVERAGRLRGAPNR